MKKTTVPIKGMHCRSCELLIEEELSSIPGVSRVSVSEKKACAEICYESDTLQVNQIEDAVTKAGYSIGFNEKKPFFSKNIADYADIFYAGVALFFLYQLVSILGLSKLLGVSGGQPTSLVTVVLIGLTAGFSTCMALVGGLVLGTATRFTQKHPNATNMERFVPHVWFTVGRIVSYTVLGGVIGGIGSFFQLSGLTLGLLTLAVALVMLTLGLQLTGLFPAIENVKLTLPKWVSQFFGIKEGQKQKYSHKNSFFLGASTFFLPCGFTQAMQLYAMSSGNPISGALIMGVFAIGTAPGLLGIGGLTSVLRGVFAQKFFKFAGVVVVALSLFNMNNAMNLIGWNPSFLLSARNNVLAVNDAAAVRDGNVQVVRMTQNSSGYEPNSFTVTKGVPVRWIINSVDQYTCAASIVSSAIGVRKNLQAGENIIEFTPQQTGTVPFSCSMGMYRGQFTVVDSSGSGGAVIPQPAIVAAAPNVPSASGSCGGSGGCGCGGARKPVVEQPAVAPVIKNDVQVIKTTYTQDKDISPNSFIVNAGTPVRLEVDVKDEGSGCMSTIMVARLTQPVFLEKGKTLSLSFTPTFKGEFPITCAMGVPRGKIIVN